MNSLVFLEKKEPVTTSLIIAEQTGNVHPGVFRLIKKHKERLERCGILGFEIRLLKGAGQPQKYAILNEQQTTLLLMLMGNNPKVMDFKELINRQFHEMKKTLAHIASNQSNEEWIKTRKDGKELRKQETDIIKKFVEYATAQGSTSARRYYSNITDMENKALFFIEQEIDNVRDALTNSQLFTIAAADQVVENAIIDGMAQKLDYHDIYKLAKDRVLQLATLIPKAPVPMTDIKALQNG